ncbi:MAG TPA: c-type cytochrome [Burkholderiaceae bacterium]|nr:c-type cytochrome [Burkholderiaceae bacterium]
MSAWKYFVFAVWALALVGPAAVSAQEARPLDSMAQRMQACAVCHGKEGRASSEGYLPRIAGKPAGYLYNQLVNFREGRRQNAAMNHLMQHMSDDYLREIARYFAELDLPYPAPQRAAVSDDVLVRGEGLVRRGDAKRDVPACVACHGEQMTGMLPAVPGLLGLPRDYLIGQLGAWRTGHRKAMAPDCMAAIAKRLTDEDIAAAASWLAAQPVPGGGKPAPAPTTRGPMECGSAIR